MANNVSIKKLILVPALITLAITLLRLIGELQQWSPKLFSREAGGGGALIGIAWLVPVFGIYFGWKLAAAGELPPSVGRAIGFAFLGLALVPGAATVAIMLVGVPPQSLTLLGVIAVTSLVGAVIAFQGWQALGRTLLAYALAARIPVLIVMLFAILGNWGTHYDVAGPGLPEMSPLMKWFMIGVLPQMTVWIWFTMVLGAVTGSITAAIKGRGARRTTA
jgi:hypothetical protein